MQEEPFSRSLNCPLARGLPQLLECGSLLGTKHGSWLPSEQARESKHPKVTAFIKKKPCIAYWDFSLYPSHLYRWYTHIQGVDLPGGSDGKASIYNVGDLGSIPGSGRSSREGNGNPLQYPMDGGAWWTIVHGVAKNWTRLSDFTFTFHFHWKLLSTLSVCSLGLLY